MPWEAAPAFTRHEQPADLQGLLKLFAEAPALAQLFKQGQPDAWEGLKLQLNSLLAEAQKENFSEALLTLQKLKGALPGLLD